MYKIYEEVREIIPSNSSLINTAFWNIQVLLLVVKTISPWIQIKNFIELNSLSEFWKQCQRLSIWISNCTENILLKYKDNSKKKKKK